jgi:hypothetical protein
MDIQKGAHGPQVKLIQEMLCFQRYSILIDSDFGPATEHAVELFQEDMHIPVTGMVDKLTNEELMSSLDALKNIKPFNGTLNEAIFDMAHKHLMVHPIEIGGQNCGPFVRFYMEGKEGVDYPWCAGFVSTVILQAFKAINKIPTNFKYQMSTNQMLHDAKTYGTLVDYPISGGLFLVMKKADHTQVEHAGLVMSYNSAKGVIETIEGNTNDEGSREGYEVCSRIRQITNKYFIDLEI